LLGALFLRTVIDGVSKIIKAGADVYEGLIVGVVVVFAVVFTRGSETTLRQRSLFAGPLGLVTIFNLTLLAGVLMALIGSRLLGNLIQMNALWLAGYSMIAVLSLFCLLRQPWPTATQKRLGLVWAVLTVAAGIGIDRYYPIAQTNAAKSAVERLGGKVVRNDAGLVVDLNDQPVDDAAFRRLESRLLALDPLVELRLRGTKLTDKSVDALGKQKKSLKTIDLRGTEVTTGGVMRLRRTQPDAQIAIDP
jgi:hypothetical protein